ncbi:Dynamin central region-domain-containing protein, partial [Blyttiomyces helicus]
VNSIIDAYMREERTTILAIVPSNQDIAIVDVLERERRVDPEGSRTIGVLTKPYLIDDGADSQLFDILENKSNPLKLGWVVVRNRSQADINSNISMLEAHRKETEFFCDHPEFARLPSAACGVTSLTCKLTSTLVVRTITLMPQMKEEITKELMGVRAEVDKLGGALGRTHSDKRALLRQINSEVIKILREASGDNYGNATFNSRPELILCTRANA